MRGAQRIACNAYNEAISRKMHASIPASWPGSYQSDHGFSQDFGLMRHQVQMSKRMIIHTFFQCEGVWLAKVLRRLGSGNTSSKLVQQSES